MQTRKTSVAFALPAGVFADCFCVNDIERLKALSVNWHEPPEKPTPEVMESETKGAEVWIGGWGTPSFSAELISSRPGLKVYAHSAGSIRHLIPDNYWREGKKVITANAAIATGVAEHSLAFLIMGLKQIIPHSLQAREGKWRDRALAERTRDIFRVRVGVISAGQVGREILRLLRAFEVEKLLYDPFVDEFEAMTLGAKKATLEEATLDVDAIVLAAPKLPETNKLISADLLKRMRDDTVIVNCSRGSVIDEPAMIEELKKGRLYALMDVTEPEPPAADSPLRSLPNVVLTPHIAGSVTNGKHRQGRMIVDDIERYLSGLPMLHEVSEQRFKIMA